MVEDPGPVPLDRPVPELSRNGDKPAAQTTAARGVVPGETDARGELADLRPEAPDTAGIASVPQLLAELAWSWAPDAADAQPPADGAEP
jgi:hypothetical protein